MVTCIAIRTHVIVRRIHPSLISYNNDLVEVCIVFEI